MRYEIEDIQDILFEGTEEQIKGLSAADCGGILKYSFDPGSGSFTILCGNEGMRGHGARTPNCVALFGNEHDYVL